MAQESYQLLVSIGIITAYLLVNLIIAHFLGRKTFIGFGWSFFLCVLLTPFIGLIIILSNTGKGNEIIRPSKIKRVSGIALQVLGVLRAIACCQNGVDGTTDCSNALPNIIGGAVLFLIGRQLMRLGKGKNYDSALVGKDTAISTDKSAVNLITKTNNSSKASTSKLGKEITKLNFKALNNFTPRYLVYLFSALLIVSLSCSIYLIFKTNYQMSKIKELKSEVWYLEGELDDLESEVENLSDEVMSLESSLQYLHTLHDDNSSSNSVPLDLDALINDL